MFGLLIFDEHCLQLTYEPPGDISFTDIWAALITMLTRKRLSLVFVEVIVFVS